ncbi:MAG TPA: DUF202 domain-containing protein [Aromatoleum sp.]|uniref:YidH family protein n=1 Tax=Aromatoleum sp. TaxID=2307007 RepID=UPI002B4A8A8A|nr:DUF202 domain-containing protein [Aromatoleum sp.]HJV25915.1 DUF202 domain-containing protein [Aromatoleum sp.]
MSLPDSDPRVFFAAERTLLAWLRTGITIIGLGFVVSRFGLFLQLVASSRQLHPALSVSWVSEALGIGFVLAGALAIGIAALQHRRFVATLPLHDLPSGYSRLFALALSSFVAALGLALAAYLFFVGS